MKRTAILLLIGTVLLAASCRRKAQESNEAIAAAIRAHLSQRSDLAMDKMTLEVEKVDFKGDTAEADVVFRLKDTPGAMAYHYTLRREGEKWMVERGRGRGVGEAQMPPGHPPTGGSSGSSQKPPRTGER